VQTLKGKQTKKIPCQADYKDF